MTGGRVKRIQKYIGGDRFMLTYGDGVADLDVQRLLEFHEHHGRLATVPGARPATTPCGRWRTDGVPASRIFLRHGHVSRIPVSERFVDQARSAMEDLAMNETFWRDRPTLITGATGLVGGWLTPSLLRARADVVCPIRDWVTATTWRSGRLRRWVRR